VACQQNFYYTVGFEAGSDAAPAGYVRAAFLIDDLTKTYTMTSPVKALLKVIDGVDAGPIGDDWDWAAPSR
jgi:hypothetical protein